MAQHDNSSSTPRSTAVELVSAPGGLAMTFRPTPVPALPKALGTGVPKSPEEVAEILKERVGASALKPFVKAAKGDSILHVETEKLLDVLKVIRDDDRLLCTHMLCVSAVDYLAKKGTPATETAPAVPDEPGRIEVVYHVSSFTHRHIVAIKVAVDREAPKVPTASDLFRAANWYERECYEMTGVEFTNHPHLENLLLPSDWVGHPLRRDYVFPEEYNGMKVPL